MCGGWDRGESAVCGHEGRRGKGERREGILHAHGRKGQGEDGEQSPVRVCTQKGKGSVVWCAAREGKGSVWGREPRDGGVQPQTTKTEETTLESLMISIWEGTVDIVSGLPQTSRT